MPAAAPMLAALLPGMAPPPVGPRLPNPEAIEHWKRAIEELFKVIQTDEVLAKHVNPEIEALVTKLRRVLQPPPSPRRGHGDAGAGSLDRTPVGVPGSDTLPRMPPPMGMMR